MNKYKQNKFVMLVIYVFYKNCYNTHTLQHQVLGNLKNIFISHTLYLLWVHRSKSMWVRSLSYPILLFEMFTAR